MYNVIYRINFNEMKIVCDPQHNDPIRQIRNILRL